MKTILLIEDDPQIRGMVRDLLELENYTCVIAPNGREGADLASKILPDIIISDVMMPIMNGFELKAELKKNPVTSLIPFLFLTSKADRSDIRTGMELGADDYLFKPFKKDELLGAIEVQLQKREALVREYAGKITEKPAEQVSYNEFIMVKDKGNPRFIGVATIVLIIAEEKYTKVVLDSKEKIIASRSMKEWEELLPAKHFVRIHRAYIVNLAAVEKTEKWFNRSYRVKIRGIEEPVFISKRYYTQIKNLF